MVSGNGVRFSICGIAAACALLAGGAFAQGVGAWPGATSTPRAGLGLQPNKVEISVGCGASLLPCRGEDAALALQPKPDAMRWSLELGTLNLGPGARAGGPGSRQGLNLSLVGKRPLFGTGLSVFGKVGSTYGYTDAAPGSLPALAAPAESGYGVSFGAGVSMDVTPRLSATLGWDSHELRLGGRPRDSVRATSMGLQYRY